MPRLTSTHSSSFDWREIAMEQWEDAGTADPRLRIWLGGALFVALLGVVFGRLVWLHGWQADDFRRVAARPIERHVPVAGTRGRILARDGSVLAVDDQLASLAVRYRWFQNPPDPSWLRWQARARLTGAARRDPQQLKAAQRRVLAAREQMHARLAELSQLPLSEWRRRTSRIQAHVEAISRRVNERRLAQAERVNQQQQSERAMHAAALERLPWGQRLLEDLSSALWPEQQSPLPPPIVVAEELDAHIVVAGLSLEAVAHIGAHPAEFPGVEIVPQWRRRYPAGTLASHLLGHLGAPDAASGDSAPAPARIGRMGVERFYEQQLRGAPGLNVEVMHRDGQLVSTRRQREPTIGRDLVLSLDLDLQRAAEALLDGACRRRDALAESDQPTPSGGAIVVLDVHSGALLAAASAPRFDPNWFSSTAAGDDSRRVAALLADPAHPLFDRTSRMALPPGSVFKPLTAIAMLSSGSDARQKVFCRGYLHRPDAMRCALFTRHGHGHGEVDLFDALAQSCNVYFFQAAAELGAGPLVDWSRRFGFAQPTGVDVTGEAAGHLPDPIAAGQRWQVRDTQALAIGQSSLTATPLQIARFMAAIANGGLLVTPHLAERWGVATDVGTSDPDAEQLADDLPWAAPVPVPRLDPQVLETLRGALTDVVATQQGTAHATVHLEQVPIAGKTGTAQAGGGRPDHAWFAGYCPAEAPKVAFVVALEHGGDGGSVAGPVARRLVERMHQLRYFHRRLTRR